MRDCLRQTGVLWSDVHLAVWQIRQRRATWEPCRAKDSMRHANKSLLSISSGDALSVFFRSRQLLSFTVTRVSRTHCIRRCTVTVCQLTIISLLMQCLLSVCAEPLFSGQKHSYPYMWQLLLFICVFSNLSYCSFGSFITIISKEATGILYWLF